MYKFPLGSVLNHRKTIEEGHQKELGLLKKSLNEELNKSGELKKARQKVSKQLNIKQKDNITASEIMLYYSYIEQLSEKLDIQEKRLLEVEKEVEVKREELIAAMKDRKILEKLKERGVEKYNKNLIKKEQEFMNEMASVRFSLKPDE